MIITGHEKEKDIFRNIIEKDKLHHAYIFSGREGSGKKLFAKELARGVVCDNQSFLEPCPCRQCTVLKNGTHPDIHMLEESPIKIEAARAISADAFMSPLSSKKKVYIIDNAHTFTREAANAVLKSLEEPPADTHFFLITDKYDQILPTIRSRCINIMFSSLTNEEVEKVLLAMGHIGEDTERLSQLSSGSVSYALFLMETMSETGEFSPSADKAQLYKDISALDTKEKIRAYCASMYAYMLEKYKKTGSTDAMDFSNYLLDILKRLEYNVSLDMFRMDLYTKTTEVLSEKN